MMRKHRKIDSSEFYPIVKFEEQDLKLFEAIPDVWFVDSNKTACYWPLKGKSFKLRALSKEKPDSSWKITPCILVSGVFVTYNAAFLAAKEKIDKENISSADDIWMQRTFAVNIHFWLYQQKKVSKVSSPKTDRQKTVKIRRMEQVNQNKRKTLLLTQTKSSNRKQTTLKENPNEVEASTQLSINPLNEGVQTKCVPRKQAKPDSFHLEGSDHESLANSPPPHSSRSRRRRTIHSDESSVSSRSIHGSVRARSSSGSRQSSRCSDRSIRSISKSGSRRSDSRSSSSSCSESDRTTNRSRSNSKSSSRSRSKSSSSLCRGNSYQNSTKNRSNSTNKKCNGNCIVPVSLDALDRRITRMEVTINKIFVMVGDIIKHSNKNMRSRRSDFVLFEIDTPSIKIA